MKKKDSLNIKTKRKAFRVAAAALALTTAITSWSLISNDKNKNNDHGHDHESTIENIHSEDNNVVDNEVEHDHEEEKEDIKEEDNIKGEEDEPVKEEPQKEYQDKVDNDKPEERPMYKDGKLIIPDLSNQEYQGDSISKALLLAGYNNSYEYRCLLAAHFGIENYRGTKEQNLLLLSYLRNLELFYKNHNEESNNNVNDNGNINNDNTNNGNNDNSNTNDNTNNDNNNNNNTNEDDKKPGEDDQKPEEGKHKHKWSPWAYISDLLEGRKCQDNTCNEVETRGHKLAENKTTYKDLGNGTHQVLGYCTSCKHDVVKDAVPCNYTEWKVNPKNKAEETRTCLDCGHVETRARVHECEEHVSKWSWLNKDKEAGKCDICGKEITRAHADKEEVVTCEFVDDSGHRRIVQVFCNECDPLHEHVISEVFKVLGHTQGIQIGKTVYKTNADGTHDETITYSCKDCYTNYTITLKGVSCNYTEWKVNPKNKAEEIRTCLDCGHKETRARVHECEEHVSKWSWLNKDKEAGKCDICGKEITRAHADKEEVVTYQYVDESGHKKTVEIYCNACDLLHEHPLSVVVDTIEHNKGEQVGDAIVIDNNNGTHTIKTTYHCSDCNMNYAVIDENVPCKFTEWIVNPNNKAEEIRTCLDCGHVETRARVHECSEHVTKWEWADKDQEKGVCDICGKDVYRNHPATDKVEVVTCTYLDDSGHVRTIKLYCNLCDPSHSKLISESIETIAHNQGAQIGETVTTPNNNGTHKVVAKFMCDDCNHEYNYVEDNVLCNYSNWIMVEGEKKHYKLCSDCGYTLTGNCVNTNGSCQDCGRDMSHTHSYIEAGVGTPTPEDGDDVCKVIIKKCQNDDCDTPEIREVIYHEWINREQYDDTMDQVTCSHCMTQIQIPWNSEDPKYPPMLDTTDLYVAYEEALNDYINNYELTVVAEDKKVLKLEK